MDNPINSALPVEARGQVRLRRPDRMQMTMRMECDDDLIPKGHQARVVWDVTGRLDLSAFHEPIKAREGASGRKATDPRLLIALWLYASTCGVGSARELAVLCSQSKPYIWLCGGVSMNHHSLSDFRVGHGKPLDDLFTQVLASLVDKGLVKVHRISQDGTRTRAGGRRVSAARSAYWSCSRKPRPTLRNCRRCWRIRRSPRH